MNCVWYSSFFLQKFKHKGGIAMFSDEILEKLFARPELQKYSIEEQSKLINVFEQVLEETEEQNDATISES